MTYPAYDVHFEST